MIYKINFLWLESGSWAKNQKKKKEKKFYKPEVFLQLEVLPTFNIHPPYKIHVEGTLLFVLGFFFNFPGTSLSPSLCGESDFIKQQKKMSECQIG